MTAEQLARDIQHMLNTDKQVPPFLAQKLGRKIENMLSEPVPASFHKEDDDE